MFIFINCIFTCAGYVFIPACVCLDEPISFYMTIFKISFVVKELSSYFYSKKNAERNFFNKQPSVLDFSRVFPQETNHLTEVCLYRVLESLRLGKTSKIIMSSHGWTIFNLPRFRPTSKTSCTVTGKMFI